MKQKKQNLVQQLMAQGVLTSYSADEKIVFSPREQIELDKVQKTWERENEDRRIRWKFRNNFEKMLSLALISSGVGLLAIGASMKDPVVATGNYIFGTFAVAAPSLTLGIGWLVNRYTERKDLQERLAEKKKEILKSRAAERKNELASRDARLAEAEKAHVELMKKVDAKLSAKLAEKVKQSSPQKTGKKPEKSKKTTGYQRPGRRPSGQDPAGL